MTQDLGRRTSSRRDVWLPATVTIEGDDFDVEIKNVSLGGALVRISHPLAMGARVHLTFVLDGLLEVIDATTVVRWRTGDQVGLQFDGLRARETWALSQYLKPDAAELSA
ncbi:MAG: PilZ domain-containing protein [Deltaproteobacteria bacterium]|nr:PilZ domain-containing protein [Deltaproteobacteria bacterium]